MPIFPCNSERVGVKQISRWCNLTVTKWTCKCNQKKHKKNPQLYTGYSIHHNSVWDLNWVQSLENSPIPDVQQTSYITCATISARSVMYLMSKSNYSWQFLCQRGRLIPVQWCWDQDVYPQNMLLSMFAHVPPSLQCILEEIK